MIKIGMDLGGSGVRYGSTPGEIKTFTSPFMEIAVASPLKDYIENQYCDMIIVEGGEFGTNRRIVRDEAMASYRGTVTICDNLESKSEQEITYINAIWAIAERLARLTVKEPADIIAGICIPTGEFYSNEVDFPTLVKERLEGCYVCKFPIPDITVQFTVSKENIRIFPEGVVVAMKFIRMQSVKGSAILIPDVGYRSTDITILDKNFKPVGKSAISVPIGGINIEAILISELGRNDIQVNQSDIRDALATGEIKSFGKKISIVNYINVAKMEFLGRLRTEIVNVLANAMMSTRQIPYLLPVGRTFIKNNYAGEIDTAVKLRDMLSPDMRLLDVQNLEYANVEEVIGALNRK